MTRLLVRLPQIGFLLSVPRLPGMVEKENFEIEGLDFIVSVQKKKEVNEINVMLHN